MALLRSVSFHYNVDEMPWEPSSGLCQLACKMGLVMSFRYSSKNLLTVMLSEDFVHPP